MLSSEEGPLKYTTIEVHGKPLKMRNALLSTMQFGIHRQGADPEQERNEGNGWGLRAIVKTLPSGIWGKCEFPRQSITSAEVGAEIKLLPFFYRRLGHKSSGRQEPG